RTRLRKNDAFLKSERTPGAQSENAGGADAALPQAAKIPEARGDGRGGPKRGRCAYPSRLPRAKRSGRPGGSSSRRHNVLFRRTNDAVTAAVSRSSDAVTCSLGGYFAVNFSASASLSPFGRIERVSQRDRCDFAQKCRTISQNDRKG